MSNEAPAIEVRALKKSYGARRVLKSLDLTVPQGIVQGLLGPNGAGKSTFISILCGLVKFEAGTVRVAGVDPAKNLEQLRQVLGVMPQEFSLYEYLSVTENLRFFADLYFSSGREARARVDEVIDMTGLGDFRGQRAEALSGGWRQRLALGAAIIHRPKVLILDEPTAAVDPLTRRLFWNLLRQLHERGTTILVTTHLMEEVERCQNVALLAEGELSCTGSPRQLKSRIDDRFDLFSVRATEIDRVKDQLRSLQGVVDAYFHGEEIIVTLEPGRHRPSELQARLNDQGLEAELDVHKATMEDVFVHETTGTGRQLSA